MSNRPDLPNPPRVANPEVFLFMPHERSRYQAFRVVVILFFGAGVLVSASLIVLLFLNIKDLNYPGTLVAIAFSLFFTSGAFVGCATYLVLASDIVLENDGVRLHLLGPWSILIPWGALCGIAIFKIKTIDPIKRERAFWQPLKRTVLFAIHAPGLTFLHTLAGFRYRFGLYPVFFVTPYHDRHELLMEKLKQAALEQGCDPENLAW